MDKTFDKKNVLNTTETILRRPIFNNANENLYQADLIAGKERLSNTHYVKVFYMIQDKHESIC